MASVPLSPIEMKKIEYTVVTASKKDTLQDVLNEQDKQFWELIAIQLLMKPSTIKINGQPQMVIYYECYFKRELNEAAPFDIVKH